MRTHAQSIYIYYYGYTVNDVNKGINGVNDAEPAVTIFPTVPGNDTF